MANFAETLTYWYLRLNGFFPVRDYVLHRHDVYELPDGVDSEEEPNFELQYSADCDLLAIRLPHVYEPIGGHSEDWDKQRFREWGLKLTSTVIGLIVEVKTSPNLDYMHLAAFTPDRLSDSVTRLGIIERRYLPSVLNELAGSDKCIVSKNKVIAKLLVTAHPVPVQPEWNYLALSDIEEFIKERVKKYRERKAADRMFFPDDLMQYFTWKGGRE